MQYPEWFDVYSQREFLDQEYDKFMADSYRRCLVNDWWFPEEVLDWFHNEKTPYILGGDHPITAEGKVLKKHNLSQLPWSFMHLGEGGAKRWNASPEEETPSTPTPAPVATLSVEIRTHGNVRT